MSEKKTEKSMKEKAILQRAAELEYATDRLGAGSLMTQQSHTNASREIMVNHQITHMVNIKDPEMPLVPTGFENPLSKHSYMLDPTDATYQIVAKFEKNPYVYVLVGYDKKNKRYHAWERQEVEEHSEGFSTRYNNSYMDSLEIDDVVPKGTYMKKSESFDKYMNYNYGKNLNTVYLVSSQVLEDGILIMGGADHMMNTYRSYTETISLADNEVLLNWYGDEDHYQGIPKIGEKTKKGILAVIRRVDNAKAPYALKKKRLRTIERGDRRQFGTGRVVDVIIYYNKERGDMVNAGANRMIAELYDKQQAYYMKLHRYLQGLIDRADSEGYTYSDELSTICKKANQFVDATTFFTDEEESVFGNMQIKVRLIDEEKLSIGSKLVGRSGNKGVISNIFPPNKSWKMEDGTPIHAVVATLGIVGRLNQSQMNEHSINELSATAVESMKLTDDLDRKGKIVYNLMKYLNSDEATAFKKYFKELSMSEKAKFCKRIERDGIYIVQDPIDNADIFDIARAYEEFPAKWQHIVFPDGKMSMRKVLCAKMFYMRLKQDPLEKYSARSRGPVNPLTNLPGKSTMKKKGLEPFSDVAVRFGEYEIEVLEGMLNHPAVVADFMMENSTSWVAKMAMAEIGYLGDLGATEEEDVELDKDGKPKGVADVDLMRQILDNIPGGGTGKKNMEVIMAYSNILGDEIVVETETASNGEWFED